MKNLILHIRNFFNRTHHIPPPLGRWNIEVCNKKLNNKIDRANEDHCGPCGQYIKNKLTNNIKLNE